MSAREILPAKRGCLTCDFVAAGRAGSLSIGTYADGRPAEVFVHLGRHGDMPAHLAADICVIVSIALQYGAPLEVIAAALLRDTVGLEVDRPASIAGDILEAMADLLRVGAP